MNAELEWKNVDSVCAWCYAKTHKGEYKITWSFDEEGQKLCYPDGRTEQFRSRNDAKRAAQRDYAQ